MLNKTDTNASLAKGLKVLECFSLERPRLSITDVAAATGLERATARRCLLTLAALGYAEHDGKYFTLTPRVLRLGMRALAALPLPQAVQPWLDQLSEQIGQSVSVSVLDETEIVYVARAARRRVTATALMPGSRLPAHCTSMGRVLLAALPEREARALIEASDLTPRTTFSRTAPEDIMAEVAAARRQGYALVSQEMELGLRSLAVPVLNAGGKVVAALNIGLAAGEAEPEAMVERFLPPLQKVSESVRRLLV